MKWYDLLQGYKTEIGGIGFILTGVGGICTSFADDSLNMDKFITYCTLISTGISIFGGRSYLKKKNGV